MKKARRSLGFTLVEMLVAVALMALMGVMAWRGLDSMQAAQIRLTEYADDTLALQTGLGQWAADLDAIALQASTPSLAWDGRVLRVLRRGSASPSDGLRVVAWSQRQVDGISHWLRWQSPSLRTRAELDAAWAQAARWGHNPSSEDRLREVLISPISQWQIFYYRNNAWTNSQSSASAADANALPEGVRLVLTLPAGQTISGELTRDWARTEGSITP